MSYNSYSIGIILNNYRLHYNNKGYKDPRIQPISIFNSQRIHYLCFVNSFKSIFAVVLIAFTFLGNVGVNVFTHSCKKNGDSLSFFIQAEDNCKEHHKKEIENVPPCCKKKAITSCDKPVVDKNCCTDQVDLYAIQLNFYSNSENLFSSSLFDLDYQKITPVIQGTHPEINKSEQLSDPPPKPKGQELLILNQVFRI